MRKPRRLPDKGRIAVVAPASPLRDERLERGLQYLSNRGYRLVLGQHLYDSYGYLAGTDEARANDLQEMLTRDDVDAVICARGGYGTARIVDLIDWQAVARKPRALVGYSDITTLHLAMAKHCQLVTFYGPMVTTLGENLAARSETAFWHLLTNPAPLGALTSRATDALRTIVPGKARGRLAGGCLCLLCAALGTPEAPDFSGAIVVIEDTDEPLYRVDRMLVQLVRSGCCDDAAGFAVGTVSNLQTDGPDAVFGLDELLRDILSPLGKPVLAGIHFGHVDSPLTIPLGCTAELDASAGRLSVTEGAVL